MDLREGWYVRSTYVWTVEIPQVGLAVTLSLLCRRFQQTKEAVWPGKLRSNCLDPSGDSWLISVSHEACLGQQRNGDDHWVLGAER